MIANGFGTSRCFQLFMTQECEKNSCTRARKLTNKFLLASLQSSNGMISSEKKIKVHCLKNRKQEVNAASREKFRLSFKNKKVKSIRFETCWKFRNELGNILNIELIKIYELPVTWSGIRRFFGDLFSSYKV